MMRILEIDYAALLSTENRIFAAILFRLICHFYSLHPMFVRLYWAIKSSVQNFLLLYYFIFFSFTLFFLLTSMSILSL